MYAELLSHAMERWEGEFSEEALFDYALACRLEMLSFAPASGSDAYLTLAKEIAYDRSLMKLCSAYGIDANAADFSHPSQERIRLERALAVHGVRLSAHAKHLRG
jgi:hypothetical protein